MTEPQRWVEGLGYEQDRQQPLKAVHGVRLAGALWQQQSDALPTVFSSSSRGLFCRDVKCQTVRDAQQTDQQQFFHSSHIPKHQMLVLRPLMLNSGDSELVSTSLLPEGEAGDVTTYC